MRRPSADAPIARLRDVSARLLSALEQGDPVCTVADFGPVSPPMSVVFERFSASQPDLVRIEPLAVGPKLPRWAQFKLLAGSDVAATGWVAATANVAPAAGPVDRLPSSTWRGGAAETLWEHAA